MWLPSMQLALTVAHIDVAAIDAARVDMAGVDVTLSTWLSLT